MINKNTGEKLSCRVVTKMSPEEARVRKKERRNWGGICHIRDGGALWKGGSGREPLHICTLPLLQLAERFTGK